MPPVPIAYFIDHLKVGGAQRHLVEVLRRLDRQRFAPQVWTLRGEGELIQEAEQLAIPVRSFGLGSRLQDLHTVALLRRTAQTLRREHVQIVHTYLSFANIVGTLAAAFARVPVLLVSKRSLDSYHRKFEAWSHWAINRFADKVVANADAVKDFVVKTEGCPAGKIVVIPNGVNDEFVTHSSRDQERAAFGFKPDERVIGTLGRLAWKKGQEYFLEAAATILQTDPRVSFALVGDGPLRSQLEEKTRKLGIAPRVKFLGQRLDSQAMISLFDIFVLPSVIEGMPNALLEAMALEKPVVVTEAGGNAEVVHHEESGLVVPIRNAEAMAQAILRLLKDNVLAQRLAAAARQSVHQHFSFRHTLQAMQTLYEEMLAAKGVQLQTKE